MKNPRKGALRQAVRAARGGLSAHERRARSAAICRRLQRLKAFREAGTILAYHSVGSEVETGALVRAALRAGKRVALPVSLKKSWKLVFRQVCGRDGELVAGLAGIPEPRRSCPVVRASEADLILVPGTAFDPQGWRIGAGAGFYDRFLARARRATRIGLAFEVQMVPSVPHDPHDERLDMIATERRLIRCPARGKNAE